MKENLKTVKWILRGTKQFIPSIIVIAIISIVVSFLSVKYSLVTRDVIDTAVSGSRSEFIDAIVIMLVYLVAITALGLINRGISGTTSSKIDMHWKKRLLCDLLYCDYEEASTHHSGSLYSRLSRDVGVVDEGIVSFFPGVLATLTRLITAVIIMGSLDLKLTIIICIGGVILVICSTMLRDKLKEIHKQVHAAEAKVTGFLQETIERLMMIQSLDVGKEIEKKEEVLLKERLRMHLKKKNFGIMASGSLKTVCIIAEFLVMIYFVVKLRNGLITFGTMTAMIQLFGKLESPFVSFSSIIPKYIAMLGSAERLKDIVDFGRDYPEEVDSARVYSNMNNICGRELWFKYRNRKGEENEYVIQNMNFDIKKNTFCAITGHSGIGKSTLLKLLLGIVKPTQGELYVDSDDMNEGNTKISRATRSLFSYVPQGNILMSGTIRENILLAKPDATEEEFNEAVEVADINSFASLLPEGLDTKLGENALGISEGQAQRVSIARAVISGKPILMLDEATSSLDGETERKVLEKLKKLPDRTIIAVTHRPAAMQMADCVVDLIN